MDDLLANPLAVAVVNLGFFVFGALLAYYWPFPAARWWPRVVWALASFCLVRGLLGLWMLS